MITACLDIKIDNVELSIAADFREVDGKWCIDSWQITSINGDVMIDQYRKDEVTQWHKDAIEKMIEERATELW